MLGRFRGLTLAALGLALVWLSPVDACPFCVDERGPTLAAEFDQAKLVIVGIYENTRPNENGINQIGDFHIETVLKGEEILKGKSVLQLPNPRANNSKTRFLLFCDIYKGKIDPYRGVDVPPNSDLLKYLGGALTLKSKSPGERLRYCFDFLTSPEMEVSLDAYREFAKADYADYKDIAAKLPADTLAEWLRDPKTPAYRYGLYASLLGHCGKAEHAKLLYSMLQDPEKRKSSGVDGLMVGYVMIDPNKGWDYVSGVLKDPSQPFGLRYTSLRTLRFYWDQRPDLLPREKIITGVASLLAHGDMADFAIEDLRKWQRWDYTDTVLKLASSKAHKAPVVQRAVLRFALQSPEKQARDFVAEQRKRDAEWVADAEELLSLESK